MTSQSKDRIEKDALLENNELREEVAELKARLAESEDTLRAIHGGEVDAIMVSTDAGEQVYTLKGAEEPYRVLFEQLNESALTISKDGGILYCNQSFAKAMKMSLEKVIGSNLASYVHPSDESTLRELLERSIVGPVRADVMFESRDGTSVPMQLSITFLPLVNVPTYCIVAYDLTERIKTEEALRSTNEWLEEKVQERTRELSESEHLFRTSVQSISDGLGVYSAVRDDIGQIVDFRTVFVNEAGCKLNLMSCEEQVGRDLTKLFPDFREQPIFKDYLHLVETGEPMQARSREADEVYGGGCRILRAYDYQANKLGDGFVVVWRDVTEREKIEETLKESEAKYRLLHDTMLQGVVFQNADGTIISMNPAAERILVRSPDEFIGSSSVGQERYTIQEDGTPFPGMEHPAMVALRTGKEVRDVVMGMYDHPEKTYRWIIVNAVPLFRPGEDRPYQVYTTFNDITERKRAEEALKESETKYRDLFETVQEVFYIDRLIYDKEGNVVDWIFEDLNPAGLKLLGFKDRDDAKGKKGSEVLGPEVASFYLPMIEEARRAGKAVTFEYDSPAVNKEFLTSYVVHGDRLISAQMDITEIKRIEHLVEEERARLQTVLDTLPTGVFIADATGRMVEINDAVKQIWGMDAPLVDSVDRYVEYKGWHPDTGERYKAEDWALARALTKGELIVGEVIDIERFDGRRATILNSAAPIKNQNGKIIGAVVTAQDVTEIKKAEENLKRSNAELQQFAYVASHDLQEPLRMVVSNLSRLEKRNKDLLDDKSKEYIHFAVDGGTRMRSLIDDLLDYSRIETKGKKLVPVDMNAVVAKTLTVLKIPIEENNAEIIVEPLPTITGDETQMSQVMQNLIGNAIKFHGDERPKIEVSSRQNSREWIIAVKDNGIGIKMEYADKIFQMFQRLHTREKYQGTGVGLAIVKKIVERHGGRIWVESTEGKGSTFMFTLPKVSGGGN